MTDKVQKIREGIERLKSQLIKGACASQIAMETRCKEEAYNEVLAILDTMQEEPVNKQNLSNVERTTKNWKEEPVSIDFEQELYKAFGQVKDFTLGMRIAKWFYDIGKKSREPVSENLEEAVNAYIGYAPEVDESSSTYGKRQAFKAGAQWQKAKDESITNDLGEYINELSKQFPEVSFAKLSRIAVRVVKWQEKKDRSTIKLAEDHATLAGMKKMKEQMMANAIDGDITFDYYGDDDKTYGCIAHDSFCLEDLGLKDTNKVKMIIIKED